MSSESMLRFLSSCWDNLPFKEKKRFGELWEGHKQIFSDLLQRNIELDQSVNINSIPVYLTTRWNCYKFNEDSSYITKAVFTSYQDISQGLNLSKRYLIKLSINDEEPIEIDCRGLDESRTKIEEIRSKINDTFGFNFAVIVKSNSTLQLESKVPGNDQFIIIHPPSNTDKDASEIILGLTPEELPLKTPRYPFKYKLPSNKIMSIPSLQNSIRNENLNYYVIEGPDFIIETLSNERYIKFKDLPPEVMWAKISLINEDMPFYNFGWLIDYMDLSIDRKDYLQNLQGLWFAFWQGPRPEYIKRSLYLLFGLPVSYSNGIVIEKKEGTLNILHDDNIIRSYALPSQLLWVVEIGDYVERFQPLVNGIDVFDKTNLPGFVKTEIGRESLKQFALDTATLGIDSDSDESKALEILEEHTFLPQINVNAFIRPNINISTVFTFLNNIKPLHKSFYFQVIVAIFNEDLNFEDKIVQKIFFDVTPNLEINQTNLSSDTVREDYEDLSMAPLDLDSDAIGIFERGSISVQDKNGLLPQFDVTFD